MFELWVTLVPILVADVINPVLFAFLIYAAGTNRPVINSCAVLLGHTLAYFVAGIIIAVGLEQISERLANPKTIDYVLSLVLGVIILWVLFFSRSNEKQKQAEETRVLTPLVAFGLGAVVNFIGVPFALPYFAALDQILKADLTPMTSLAILGGYNLLYALPFAVVPVLTATSGKESQEFLQRINEWLERISNYIMPVLLALVGLALVLDSVFYFVTGKGIFHAGAFF